MNRVHGAAGEDSTSIERADQSTRSAESSMRASTSMTAGVAAPSRMFRSTSVTLIEEQVLDPGVGHLVWSSGCSRGRAMLPHGSRLLVVRWLLATGPEGQRGRPGQIPPKLVINVS